MRAYNPRDYEQLSQWCYLRDKSPPKEEYLPESGIIVDGVAAGFFIFLSNNCGMLEFYISNPRADREERKTALFDITRELIEVARDSGVKMLMCSTQSGAIKRLAMKSGFKEIGEFTEFAMEL